MEAGRCSRRGGTATRPNTTRSPAPTPLTDATESMMLLQPMVNRCDAAGAAEAEGCPHPTTSTPIAIAPTNRPTRPAHRRNGPAIDRATTDRMKNSLPMNVQFRAAVDVNWSITHLTHHDRSIGPAFWSHEGRDPASGDTSALPLWSSQTPKRKRQAQTRSGDNAAVWTAPVMEAEPAG